LLTLLDAMILRNVSRSAADLRLYPWTLPNLNA
jgi:hypothetical protein